MDSNLDPAQRRKLEETLKTLEQLSARRRYRAFEFFKPYPKQEIFFEAGEQYRERLLMAGNQLGKSHAGAYEMALHLTGLYPKDWKGRRFTHPITAWAAGVTSEKTRDVCQAKLCGKPGVEQDFGTGMIPHDALVAGGAPSLSRGLTDAYDTIFVQHYDTAGAPDGISTCQFKSFEQGRKKFQGNTLDVVWLDEEPPMDVYSECLTRITATGGMIYITFTPLEGRSTVVMRFLDEESPDRTVVIMTIFDVPVEHFGSAEARQKVIEGYPAHEREARANGTPMLGSGRIFPYPNDMVAEAPLAYVPVHWTKLWGVDFGINHPFAAVLSAWDRDNDVIHILHAIRVTNQLPLQHAAAMKVVASEVPVSWPHDGDSREFGTGEALVQQYRAQKLRMLGQHAQFTNGSNSTEAGVLEMSDRMTTGRLKVAAHLSDWFQEFQMYHRKDGVIVKVEDDLLSATRMVIMDKRHGRSGGFGANSRRKEQQVANDVDFDVFG